MSFSPLPAWVCRANAEQAERDARRPIAAGHRCGRVRQALARKLQQQFPELVTVIGGVERRTPLLWLPDQLYPATGNWRTNRVAMDVWCWNGYGVTVNAEGKQAIVLSIGSYTSMSELIKPGTLEIDWLSGEVSLT
jgi:hypothetical protein